MDKILKRVTFDFETRSEADLKKQGAYKYSMHPSTRATCMAFKILGHPTIYFLDFNQIHLKWSKLNSDFRSLWKRLILEEYEFSAHNAFFERCIYENILVERLHWPEIPEWMYRCTAAKAAACALPRNLEGAGAAMALTTQKDRRGYSAMMATCKPTKQWNLWLKKRIGPEPKKFLDPKDAPEVFETLYTYCKIDVETEELLDQSLPDLSLVEQEIWHFNQRLNWRGVHVDMPVIKKILGMIEIESKKKLKELDQLTMGMITKPGSIQSILKFLEIEGVKLPNLQKKTVEDQLESFTISPDAHRLLELRKTLSLTSTKKYQSFVNRSDFDHRIRDIFLYHGASTGRDTAKGIQLHNLPKGLIKTDKDRPYATVENVAECDYEMLKILYGDSLGLAFSAIIRNMIIPTRGFELFVADFSKVEVAVLWWLSDNFPGLKILNEGLDPYIYQAAANTRRNYQDIPPDGNERQLGKAQILGCGFGMGAHKFKTTAWDMFRLELTESQALEAVTNYRTANAAVPKVWKDYENAALWAVTIPNHEFKAGKCFFIYENRFLWIEIPSGRKLAYREPQISWRQTDYGPRKTLEFMAVNSKTKKWSLERTWGGVLTENIVQATARELLMYGMVRLENNGYRGLMSVHDEAICEREIGKGSLKEFTKLLCEKPSWGADIPLEAKGWTGMRYRK